jgi:hypothetical protein
MAKAKTWTGVSLRVSQRGRRPRRHARELASSLRPFLLVSHAQKLTLYRPNRILWVNSSANDYVLAGEPEASASVLCETLGCPKSAKLGACLRPATGLPAMDGSLAIVQKMVFAFCEHQLLLHSHFAK